MTETVRRSGIQELTWDEAAEIVADQFVDVTPEMIEAGAAVLCRMEPAFATEEFWAERVYRAMEARRILRNAQP